MAGHSKWANIKFKKAAQDAKRGKLFTKLIREITVAAKMGGSDPGSNPRLRTAIDKALSGNLTRDKIDKAIKSGSGTEENENLEEVTYEGYGPEGVAVMVECLTDNINRTVSEVRHAFTKHNGNLGTNGSVSYLFRKVGQIILPEGTNEDHIIDLILEFDIEDISTQEDQTVEILTNQNNFIDVKDKLVSSGIEPLFAEITMLASTNVELDHDNSEKVVKLIDRLEDLDDVQTVHTNADFRD